MNYKIEKKTDEYCGPFVSIFHLPCSPAESQQKTRLCSQIVIGRCAVSRKDVTKPCCRLSEATTLEATTPRTGSTTRWTPCSGGNAAGRPRTGSSRCGTITPGCPRATRPRRFSPASNCPNPHNPDNRRRKRKFPLKLPW